MKRLTASLFATLMILALPLAAHAKPTLLAREEVTVKAAADQGAVMADLVKKVVKKMEQHPCMVKALKEGRKASIGVKVDSVSKGDKITMTLEMWSDDCD